MADGAFMTDGRRQQADVVIPRSVFIVLKSSLMLVPTYDLMLWCLHRLVPLFSFPICHSLTLGWPWCPLISCISISIAIQLSPLICLISLWTLNDIIPPFPSHVSSFYIVQKVRLATERATENRWLTIDGFNQANIRSNNPGDEISTFEAVTLHIIPHLWFTKHLRNANKPVFSTNNNTLHHEKTPQICTHIVKPNSFCLFYQKSFTGWFF